MSRIGDFFRVPTILDINGPKEQAPYRASCPRGDWQSPRWVSSPRTAREQETKHWVSAHYRFDADSWGAGWSDGFYY
jgi:hypothetical protein